MKTVEYTVKRLVLTTPEEKSVRDSWGSKWEMLKRAEQKEGFVYLIVGEWSGYNSKQRKDVHIDISSKEQYTKNEYVGVIEYGDNTTLTVTIRKHTLESIFKNNIRRQDSYTSLIQQLISSGSNFLKA